MLFRSVDHGCAVGILTERDLTRLYAGGNDAARLPVSACMSGPLITVGAADSLNQAAALMLAHHVRHLVVLDERMRLRGVVGEHDITRTLSMGVMDGAILAERARQRAVLRAIPDLVWLKSPQGVYLACNARFEQLYGCDESRLLGHTDEDFVPREQAQSLRAEDQRALLNDGPTVSEAVLTFASDGHQALTQTLKTPVRDAEGQLIGVLGIGRDITRRRRTEAALRDLRAPCVAKTSTS